MKTTPKLQVYCPVDPAELEFTSNGIVCRKCQRGLVDVSCPGEAKTLTDGICGVMRRIAGPVVGSTIALTGCSPGGSHPNSGHLPAIEYRPYKSPPGESGIPIPGTYFHPGGEIFDPDAYPVAKRASEPGTVISPYTQSRVDVSHVSEGTLVLDPAYKMADRKFFRVPSTQKQSE